MPRQLDPASAEGGSQGGRSGPYCRCCSTRAPPPTPRAAARGALTHPTHLHAPLQQKVGRGRQGMLGWAGDAIAQRPTDWQACAAGSVPPEAAGVQAPRAACSAAKPQRALHIAWGLPGGPGGAQRRGCGGIMRGPALGASARPWGTHQAELVALEEGGVVLIGLLGAPQRGAARARVGRPLGRHGSRSRTADGCQEGCE